LIANIAYTAKRPNSLDARQFPAPDHLGLDLVGENLAIAPLANAALTLLAQQAGQR